MTNTRRTRHPHGVVIFLLLPFFFSYSSPPLWASTPDNTCEELSLGQALTASLANNPDLAAVQARYKALAAIPSQQETLPDPSLSLGVINFPADTLELDQVNMTQMQIGLSQKFPYPGKLSLKGQAATLQAEAALERIDEARLNLIRDIRKSWWNIFYLKKSLATIRANQELLRATVAAARTKYEVGKGLQQDVLLAQLELTRLLDRDLAVANTLVQQTAIITALLGRTPEQGCMILIQPDDHLDLPHIMPLSALESLALSKNPAILALRKNRAASKTRIALARRDYFPDFTVAAAYGFRQDTSSGLERSDLATIKVSMNLPLWTTSKLDQAVAQRTSESKAADYKVQDLQNRILAEIQAAFSRYRSTSEQSELYRTSLIPQAEQTAAAMLKGYQVNKVDFLNVVRAQLALYNYKITYWNYLSGAFKALAGLEAATGTSIREDSQNE